MLQQLSRNLLKYPRNLALVRHQSNKLDIEQLESQSVETDLEAIDDETIQREKEIDRMRNKSRLQPQDRNILLNMKPFEEARHWSHGTLRYQRKQYAKYGDETFNASLCWPTREELSEKMEYESVAYPYTIKELIAMAEEKQQRRNADIQKDQDEIVKNMAKLEGWKNDMFARIEKKESEAIAAKQRKDRLIEEVRRHFGYKIDPRDDRFKEMLEKKEREEKKVAKDAKKKAKEERALRLINEAAKAQMEQQKAAAAAKDSELDK